jgi:hypothetical protein
MEKRFKINNNYVNWSNWRQFNAIEKNDKNRKYVFDKFINKTEIISPIIEKRFNKIMDIYYEEGKTNILHQFVSLLRYQKT